MASRVLNSLTAESRSLATVISLMSERRWKLILLFVILRLLLHPQVEGTLVLIDLFFSRSKGELVVIGGDGAS